MKIAWDDEKPKGTAVKWDDETPSPEIKVAETKNTNPSLMDVATGPETMGDWASGRVKAAKDIIDPNYWRKLVGEATAPLPSIPTQNGRMNFPPVSPDQASKLENEAIGLVASIGPTSAVSKATRAALEPVKKGADVVKQKTLEMAGEAGYSVPRSNIKQSFLTNLGERFGGKQAIEATAQMKNQPITNKLAARALGLTDDVSITPELLKNIRTEAGKAYEAVSNIGTLTADKQYGTALREIVQKYSGASKDFPELANQNVNKLAEALAKKQISSQGAVEMVKNLRQQANSNMRGMATAEDKLVGRAQRAAADALEDLIERNIGPTLGNDMLSAYKSARQLIAKTHTVENALNEASGNVVATELVRAANKGVPLSAELKKIATFASAFPRLTREPIGAPASGGLFEPMVYGTAGSLAAGPVGVASAAVPIIGKPMARHLMTTVPKAANTAPGALDDYILQRLIAGVGSNLNR